MASREKAFAAEGWSEEDAIEELFGLRFEADEIDEGGEEIGRLNEGIVSGVGFDVIGPSDDHGDAHAAFEYGGFAAFERGVAGGGGVIDDAIHVAAVVGEEDDEGVVVGALSASGGWSWSWSAVRW